MKVDQKTYKTIWQDPADFKKVKVIDQRKLPYQFSVVEICTIDQANHAISEMIVRGAPLIGATAAWGVYLAAIEAADNDLGSDFIFKKSKELILSRPTAINLRWAVNRMLNVIANKKKSTSIVKLLEMEAKKICEEEEESSKNIGQAGLEVIKEIARKKNNETLNILTHCNAGWLATIDFGTATAPIYAARDYGIDLHVWVDETRPRNQGSSLTAWELTHENINNTIIVDNAGGYLMQNGDIDLCLVGSDRTTKSGDVCNKIGTYLKALAARDNNVPFYVALPESTFDWSIEDGLKDIPIELRDEDEIAFFSGFLDNKIVKARSFPEGFKSLNIAFDVTPSKYITGLITPRGVCEASRNGITSLYPEYY